MTGEDLLAEALGHAAQYANEHGAIGVGVVGVGAQAGVDLLLRPVADGAGVVEDRVGAASSGENLVPGGAEQALDELAVEPVHLTAHRFEVDLHEGLPTH